MSVLSIPINQAGVAGTDVAVAVAIAQHSVLYIMAIDNGDALVTIPALGLRDIPAPLLRKIPLNYFVPTDGNMNFLVRISTGATETVTGVITGQKSIVLANGIYQRQPRGMLLAPGAADFTVATTAQFDIVQGTNFPVKCLGFSVDDQAFWDVPLRAYAGGDITLELLWYAAATSGNVNWDAALAAITIGTDTGSIEAKALATAIAEQTATSGNAKAGVVTTIVITGASLDSASFGDYGKLRVRRIAASASEMAGDALLLGVSAAWD